MIYIISLLSLVFILASLKDLRFSLGLILLGLPLYQVRFMFLSIPLTLLETWIFVFIFIWFLKKGGFLKIKKLFLSLGTWKWIIIFWLLSGLLAIIISPDLRAGLGIFKAYFLEPVLVFMVGFDIIKSKKDFSIIIFFTVCLGVLVSLWAILQKFFGGGIMSLEILNKPEVWRATGPFPHPNFLGLLLGPILILGFSWIVSFSKTTTFKILGFIFVFILGAALVLAKTEGAIIGSLAGFFIMSLFYKPKLSFIVLIIAFLLLFLSPYKDMFLEKVTLSDLSGKLRLNIWEGALDLLSENMILGVGLSGYQELIPGIQKAYFDKTSKKLVSVETHPYPHNLFLSLWLELGLFGLLIFLWIIIRFFYLGLLKLKKVRSGFKMQILGVMGAMIVVLVHGLVDTPYFKNDLSILFWFLVLLMAFLYNKKAGYGEVA